MCLSCSIISTKPDLCLTQLSSGKFYRADNKDEELEPLDIDQIKIPPGGEVDVNSCGRENVASGTEGSFEVYKNDDWVCSLAWDCPCGSKTNSFDSSFSDDYWITVGPWNTKSGAIGTVKVEFGEHRE